MCVVVEWTDTHTTHTLIAIVLLLIAYTRLLEWRVNRWRTSAISLAGELKGRDA